MAFSIIQKGTKLIINSSGGLYSTFEEICEEVIKRDKTLVIEEISIIIDGVESLISDGLEKIKSKYPLESLVDVNESSFQTKKEAYRESTAQALAAAEQQSNLDLIRAKKTGNWSDIPKEIRLTVLEQIVISTCPFAAGREIIQEIDVIAYECAYGMNILRDLFANVVDVVGGRSSGSEKMLRNARKEALRGLRAEAFKIGADGVIGVTVQYMELDGGGKSGMLVAIATGTAVELAPKSINI